MEDKKKKKYVNLKKKSELSRSEINLVRDVYFLMFMDQRIK
jgi:hypothetical protein